MDQAADKVFPIPAPDHGKQAVRRDLYVSYNGQERHPQPIDPAETVVVLPLVRPDVDAKCWVVTVYADGSRDSSGVLAEHAAPDHAEF